MKDSQVPGTVCSLLLKHFNLKSIFISFLPTFIIKPSDSILSIRIFCFLNSKSLPISSFKYLNLAFEIIGFFIILTEHEENKSNEIDSLSFNVFCKFLTIAHE